MVVADLTALIALVTAVLPNNQQVWVVAEDANYYLNKTSTAVIDSPLVVETDAGAGSPGRWIQGVELAEPCTPDDNPFGNCICVPPGDVAQSLLYWDGSDPVWLPPGADGQFLQIDAGLLTWGGVPAASITPGPADTVLWSDGTTAQWTGNPVVASIALGAGTKSTTGNIRNSVASTIITARNSLAADVALMTFGVDSTNDLSVGVNMTGHDTRIRGDSLFLVAGVTAVALEWTGTFLRKPNVTLIGGNANLGLRAQGSTGGGAAGHGGTAIVEGGRRDGAAGSEMGGFRFQLNDNDTIQYTMAEGRHVAGARRVLSLAFGAPITATQMPANSGDLVVFLGDAASVPSADPVSGITMYSDTARPAWRWATANSIRMNGVSATANTGAAGAPPAQVAGYLDWQVNGTQRKIPYYAA